jgi:hypothetical protein
VVPGYVTDRRTAGTHMPETGVHNEFYFRIPEL